MRIFRLGSYQRRCPAIKNQAARSITRSATARGNPTHVLASILATTTTSNTTDHPNVCFTDEREKKERKKEFEKKGISFDVYLLLLGIRMMAASQLKQRPARFHFQVDMERLPPAAIFSVSIALLFRPLKLKILYTLVCISHHRDDERLKRNASTSWSTE